MNLLRAITRRLLPRALLPSWRRSYAQEGEDLVLVSFFGDDYQGIYLDIGAHDPFSWSNTKKLVDRGWWGVNIDPRPEAAALFRKYRPCDIFLEMAIDIGSAEPLQYWVFDEEPRWNCLAPSAPINMKDGRPVAPSSHTSVPVISIEDALNRVSLDHIDLVNIDIEGGEEYILRHWPWQRYTPKAICVEIIGEPAAEIASCSLTSFLAEHDMVFTSQLVCSVIYLQRDFLATRYPRPAFAAGSRATPLGWKSELTAS
ncbi:MAG: FkbM family methyltransferase [Acetobacteraceae bacterium]|nr:FkbM family methyltransferase [Acetobacteraceae bacterium]